MKKLVVVLLLAVFAAIAPAVQNATAKRAKTMNASGAREYRWHGIIVRSNKDASTLDVRKGHIEKTVHYDSSTKWTKGSSAIEASDVKDGDDVIVLGNYNEKQELVATRIDLRSPKMLN